MSFPPLGTLRVASPSDILRIGVVATASFRYSPVFRWERPYHAKFPEDTLLSYRREFMNVIQDDEIIVLVVEDEYIPNENESTDAIISDDNGWSAPPAGEKVVVGAITLKLPPGSTRRGQMKSSDGDLPDLPPCQGRDLNRKHYDDFGEKSEAIDKKYFSEFYEMGMLCVHPAYWKKGHGSQLVQWGIELSKTDNVPQGVDAAEMGAKLVKKFGYEYICTLTLEGDEEDSEGLSTELYKFVP